MTNKEIILMTGVKENSQEYQQLERYVSTLSAMGKLQNLSPKQIYLFLNMCYLYKLDPAKNEIYCVQYGTSMTPIIAYQVYLKNSAKDPLFQMPQVETHTEDKNNIYVEFIGKRKGEEYEFRKKFYLNEWNKRQGEWLTKPLHMLEKTAMKNGLAWLYPNANEYSIIEENGAITKDGEFEINVPKEAKVVKAKETQPKPLDIKSVFEEEEEEQAPVEEPKPKKEKAPKKEVVQPNPPLAEENEEINIDIESLFK